MTFTQVMDKVIHLEEKLEAMKWEFATLVNHKKYLSIVKNTAGILGKNFPSGITCENRIRKRWNKYFKRLIQ